MTATGGIFGQLKALYQRADDHANAKGRMAISLSDIIYALPKKRQVTRLWEEIAVGEAALGTVGLEELARLAVTAREREKAKINAAAPSKSAAGATSKAETGSWSAAADSDDGDASDPIKQPGRKRRRPKPKARRPVRTC